MKAKRRLVLVGIWVNMLGLGMFVGCGHEQEKGERYEIQSNMEETGESRYEVSCAQLGTVEEAKEAGNESSVYSQSVEVEDFGISSTATASEYWSGETASIVYSDNEPEESQSQEEFAGNEQEKEEQKVMEEISKKETPEPYYLSAEDREQVIARLVEMGESYGMQYYPDVLEGETWDSPTPIYAEELLMGRDYVINAMVEYTEGAFALMQLEGCRGFALQIKEFPNTVTDAYYEVYVYWM